MVFCGGPVLTGNSRFIKSHPPKLTNLGPLDATKARNNTGYVLGPPGFPGKKNNPHDLRDEMFRPFNPNEKWGGKNTGLTREKLSTLLSRK